MHPRSCRRWRRRTGRSRQYARGRTSVPYELSSTRRWAHLSSASGRAMISRAGDDRWGWAGGGPEEQAMTAVETTSRTATDRRFGGHSMSATLRTVMVRRPAPPARDDDWRRFGYLRPIDIAQTEAEHAAFRQILADEGVDVVADGPDPDGELDSIFAYDPSFMTDGGAILTRMGKPARLAEANYAAQTYAELGIPILARIEEPGTFDGGDALWLDEGTLAVGRSYRTNDAGVAQLQSILGGIGVEVVRVDLPHWHGPAECLHLM